MIAGLQMGRTIIAETFSRVLPARFDSPEARRMLEVIGLQESRFEHRHQINGPAVSFWQFELGGGIVGVLTHPASKSFAIATCAILGVPPTPGAVYAAMVHDDLLGCAFARLLLYTDSKPLPELGDVDGSWNYYERNWRPGQPHPETWPGLYAQAAAP